MQDHTHLQLCFSAEHTRLLLQTKACLRVLQPLFQKQHLLTNKSLLGNTKACCHHVVEQVAKGTFVDKYAKKVLVCKSSTPFRVILSA